MDHDTRRFVREAKREMHELIEQCSYIVPADDRDTPAPLDDETELIMRSSVGGSANLAFFLPYLWRHRR